MEGEKIKVEERDKGGERKDCELPKEHEGRCGKRTGATAELKKVREGVCMVGRECETWQEEEEMTLAEAF